MSLKIGDIVTLSETSSYYHLKNPSTSSNPIKINGKIENISKVKFSPLPFTVKWNNNTFNSYTKSDLKLVKIKQKNMLSTFKLKLVEKTANTLLQANNTITTLEIKNALRRKYPSMVWNQDQISLAMIDFTKNNKYNYNDNGTYRVYSSIKPTVSTKTVVTSIPRKSNNRISRKRALELIQNSNGKFFGVVFTKKNGEERKMTCKIDKNKLNPSHLGYLTVFDVKDNNTPKSLNLQTLSELKTNKTFYKVN